MGCSCRLASEMTGRERCTTELSESATFPDFSCMRKLEIWCVLIAATCCLGRRPAAMLKLLGLSREWCLQGHWRKPSPGRVGVARFPDFLPMRKLEIPGAF